MAYVTIPKDLSRIQSKVLFGLTKRQVICFGAAHMGNRIALMLSQIDLRVHAHKMNVGTIVFTGSPFS